jgi:hypothetical protein
MLVDTRVSRARPAQHSVIPEQHEWNQHKLQAQVEDAMQCDVPRFAKKCPLLAWFHSHVCLLIFAQDGSVGKSCDNYIFTNSKPTGITWKAMEVTLFSDTEGRKN